MFGWEEVYMCFAMDEYIKAQEALGQESIPYKRKLFARGGTWMGRETTRVHTTVIIGDHTDYTKQYRLFVKTQDAQKARFLISKALQD